MQGQLKKVQHIQATSRAFAALTEDGSVVTWDLPRTAGTASLCRAG